jgi:cell wall-associated NlpC family hydrolase
VKNNYFYKKPLSNIYKKPSEVSEVTSQVIYGEKFKVLSKNKNWLKIKTSFDNYIGYIKDENYTNNHYPTHKIFSLKANILNNQKNKTKYFLPFASKISIIQTNKKLVEFERNKWVKKKDIKRIDHIKKDYLKVLKLFLKTKYVWGGKTYKGIDCSAILQLLYYYNNKFYPRDTKDQLRYSKSNIKKKKI